MIYANYVNDFVQNHGKQLYHYTSIPAVYSIMKTKEFWLGSTAEMNDKAEIKHFIKLLKESLGENYSNIERYSKVFNSLDELLENKNRYPYVMAFSTLCDNAAQWERYADNARGCCLVFNSCQFLTLLQEFNFILYSEVFYDFDIKKHGHYKYLKDYFENGSLNNFNSEKSLIENIFATASTRKHLSFASEKEVRVVTLDESVRHSKIEFELIGGKVRKMLKLLIGDVCSNKNINFDDLFDKIILGPRSEQSCFELKEYFISTGHRELSNKIYASECPLR